MNRFKTILVFLVISLNCFSQYPVVIDSILISLIGNKIALIIDNGSGERQEFFFNENGKIIEENYFGLFDNIDKSDSILLFIDSTKIMNGNFITTSYTYDLKSMEIVQKNIIPPNCRLNNKIIISDSTIWQSGCNNQYTMDHVMVSKGKIFNSYKSTLTMNSGRKYVDEWRIKYEDEKVFLFNENFSTAYVIFLKNEIPFKIEKHSTSSYRNELNMQQTFIDKLNKSHPIETFEIYYGDNKKKPINKITSEKTISLYKKSIGLE